jgi:hypothetical protein
MARVSSAKASPLGVLAALAFCVPVCAQSPLGAAHSACANMGHDFVSVSGANNCVRIGAHVRAETSQVRAAPLGYASETPDGVRHVSEMFHVRAGAANADTNLYRR